MYGCSISGSCIDKLAYGAAPIPTESAQLSHAFKFWHILHWPNWLYYTIPRGPLFDPGYGTKFLASQIFWCRARRGGWWSASWFHRHILSAMRVRRNQILAVADFYPSISYSGKAIVSLQSLAEIMFKRWPCSDAYGESSSLAELHLDLEIKSMISCSRWQTLVIRDTETGW